MLEEVSHGWGVGLHFFRVSYILSGPWYLTWLTSFIVLTLMFLYGMWIGLVFRRWGLLATLAFATAQVSAALIGVITVSSSHAWGSVGHFFTTLSAAGLHRPAGRARGRAAGRRLRHHAPRHGLMREELP